MDVPDDITVECTDLFVGTPDAPRQVLRVTVPRVSTAERLTVHGAGIAGTAEVPAGDGAATVEVGLSIAGVRVGESVPVTVSVGERTTPATVDVAAPGYTVHLVSHFHYDPVWWNTQAAYTSAWDWLAADGTTRPLWERNAFALVDAHLELALRDPDYRFVLAELDYLKPYFDTHPQRRADLRRLLAEGRVELMGGTYNEPSTNLTSAETTIRNLVYGIGYQRDILGGDPATGWQLDVFGHDPQFPGYLAAAGLTGSAWARGPFHQWGPILKEPHDATAMQFPSEFEWISPSGQGVLTHYMPNHYSAGWWMDSAPDLASAERAVYDLYRALKPVAATRHILLPVGTDYSPPNKWVTEIHRSWNARYVWPRFVCAVPKDFLAAVRAELAAEGRRPSPQSRDMNPIYTGKDVSYIDTKQAQRAAEVAATDAEKLATVAALEGLGRYPEAALDKVWRHLAFGAHHDAITGSESDQVYVDLVAGWREAYDLASSARDAALDALLSTVDTSGPGRALVVTNTLSFDRTDLVRVPVGRPARLVDESGAPVPAVYERGTLVFLASEVPALGWRTYRLLPGGAPPPGWSTVDGVSISSAHFRVTASPSLGGTLSSIVSLPSGRELLAGPGNELRVYDEYPTHPSFGEGPWHLLPRGTSAGSAEVPATVTRYTSEVGERLVVTGTVAGFGYEQTVTLWHGVDRIEFATRIVDHAASDQLVRVRFPVDLPGALPVSEVAGAVVGRGYALPDVDSAEAPWTLDNPAHNWFGLSSTARVVLRDETGKRLGERAIGVAEIVAESPDRAADARDLVVALARVGVTATVSLASGPRYGWLTLDSNLPDVRIVLGSGGGPATWVPARAPLREVWRPNADLRDLSSLPRLMVPGALEDLVADLADARIEAVCAPSSGPSSTAASSGALSSGAAASKAASSGAAALPASGAVGSAAASFAGAPGAAVAASAAVGAGGLAEPLAEPLADGTVALLTFGLPGFAVDPAGALHLSLMRSCTGWPSGVWIDPPKRSAPDGSAFQLQHWTHRFDYALVWGPGDWRDAQLPARGQEFTTPLLARVVEAHPGRVPARHSYLRVEPARAVLLNTLKPTGNALASGSSPSGVVDRVTVRLTESTGLGAVASFGGALDLGTVSRATLLEEPRESADPLALAGSEVVTLLGRPASPATVDDTVLGAVAEPAQPVYARYWLHNRGPAPLGYLPVSVAVSPGLLRGGGDVEVTVASQLTGDAHEGVVRLRCPEGWRVEPAEHIYRLEPGAHLTFTATVTPAPDAVEGLYFVAAQIVHNGQTVEDVATVSIGEPDGLLPAPPTVVLDVRAEDDVVQGTASATGRDTGLAVDVVKPELVLRAGERASLGLSLANRTRDEIRGELQLVSPWGTWPVLRDVTRGFTLAGGAGTVVDFPVTVPADAEPGHAWALVKAMWYGRCQYSPVVRLVVT